MIFNCVKSEKEENVDDSDENRKLQCCQTNGGKDSPCWTVMRKREEDEWKGIGGGGRRRREGFTSWVGLEAVIVSWLRGVKENGKHGTANGCPYRSPCGLAWFMAASCGVCWRTSLQQRKMC